MKTDFQQWGGADPEMINRALEAQGSTYRVPVPPKPVAAPVIGPAVVDTQSFTGAPVQALTPEEQALGAQLAQQQVREDAAVAANNSYGNTAPNAAVAPKATPGLDWQPGPQPSQVVPPGARMSLAQPAQQLNAPQYAATQRPRVGGGISNPIPGMLKEASAGKAKAEGQRDDAELRADLATESRKLNAETLGETKADNLDSIAQIQQRIADGQQEYQDRLQLEADAHTAATDKVNAERAEIGKFINEYEPKDRRTGAQRVGGAIAVGLSGALDQNNLVAGLMQGLNVQTNNADRTASLISRGIDRDLEYQRALLDNKQTAMAGKTTELGQLREKYGDTVDTLKLARAMKIEQAQKEIDATTSRGASDEARILGQEASDKLEQEKQAIYADVFGKRYEGLRSEEQKLRMARYEQQRAAQGGVDPMKAEKLRGLQLDNAKKAKDLNAPPESKLGADERKVQRLLGAVKPARDRLSKFVGGDGAPYLGVRDGTQWVPEAFVPDENTDYRNDVLAVAGQALRDDSGAVLGPDELEEKLVHMGAFSGSKRRRDQALGDLMYEYDARMTNGAPQEDYENSQLTRPHGEQ